MRFLPILSLFFALTVAAQTEGNSNPELKRLSQMAALIPADDRFHDMWKEYVSENLSTMAEVDTTIEVVVDGVKEFRGEVRAVGGGSGAAMSPRKLRETMRELAAEVLEADR